MYLLLWSALLRHLSQFTPQPPLLPPLVFTEAGTEVPSLYNYSLPVPRVTFEPPWPTSSDTRSAETVACLHRDERLLLRDSNSSFPTSRGTRH